MYCVALSVSRVSPPPPSTPLSPVVLVRRGRVARAATSRGHPDANETPCKSSELRGHRAPPTPRPPVPFGAPNTVHVEHAIATRAERGRARARGGRACRLASVQREHAAPIHQADTASSEAHVRLRGAGRGMPAASASATQSTSQTTEPHSSESQRRERTPRAVAEHSH